MANNTTGVTVGITVDTSQMVSNLTAAKAQFTNFTSGLQTGLAQSTAAMASTTTATAQLTNTTQNLGKAIGETGSRRELRESLSILKASTEGVTGALDGLQALLLTFGTSMGGPTLIIIAAAIGALAALVEIFKKTSEAEEELNRQSEIFHLPADELKQYTTGMKDLAAQLENVKMGFATLSNSQLNIFKMLGIDPSGDPAKVAKQAFAAIMSSTDDEESKIRNVGIVFGETFDQASVRVKKFEDDSKKSANGWFADWTKSMAINEGDIEYEPNQTKGEAAGVKPNSRADTTAGARTQQQIDAQQKLQDKLTELQKRGAEARIGTIQNESAKILAQAQIETQGLLEQKAKEIAATNDPAGKQALGDQYDAAIASVNANAKTRAAQAAIQKQLDQLREAQSQINALTNAGAQAEVRTSQDKYDEIQAAGAQALTKLKQTYDTDLAYWKQQLDTKQISYQQYLDEVNGLTNAFNKSKAQISIGTNINSDQAYLDEQLAAQQSIQKQLSQMDEVAAATKVQTAQTANERIDDQAQQHIAKLKTIYTTALQDSQTLYDQGKISYQQMLNAQQTAATKYSTTSVTVATNTQQEIANQQKKPMTDLLTSWQDTSKQMNQLWATGMNDMATSLTQFVMTSKLNMAQFTQEIVADLIKIMIQKEMAGIVGSLFGGASGSVLGSTSTAAAASPGMGGYAGGGTIQAGTPVMVGERGPEMIVPNVGGTVTNNAGMGSAGGAGNVTVTINNKGTPQQATSATPQQTATGLIISVLTDDMRRGGPVTAGFAQAFGLKRSVS